LNDNKHPLDLVRPRPEQPATQYNILIIITLLDVTNGQNRKYTENSPLRVQNHIRKEKIPKTSKFVT